MAAGLYNSSFQALFFKGRTIDFSKKSSSLDQTICSYIKCITLVACCAEYCTEETEDVAKAYLEELIEQKEWFHRLRDAKASGAKFYE